MKCACIIDIDPRSLIDIRTSLEQIDGSLKLFEFSDTEGFEKWLEDNIKSLSENPKAEKIEIKLVAGDLQFFSTKNFEFLEKIKKVFMSNSFCTEEEPTSFVATAFDSPTLDHRLLENSLLNNILFKPFDKAILLQHLRVALVGHHSVSDSSVFKQKVKVQAEMLKEIKMIEFSEVGFKTKSVKPVKINSITKYYGMDLFQAGRSFSYAKCIKCTPAPSAPSEFIAEFAYFSLANAKNKFLRQELFKKHDEPMAQIKNSTQAQNLPKINIAVIQDFDNPEIKEFLEKKYRNIAVDIILDEVSMAEVFNDKKIRNAVIINLKLYDKEIIQKWRLLIDQTAGVMNADSIFLVAINKELDDLESKEYSGFMTDTLQLPLDRTYLFKRLSQWFPQLITAEDAVTCFSRKIEKTLKVAIPVDLDEISEAGLSMKYYREISYSSFRRFSLGVAENPDAPEILGSCFFHEKVGDVYVNHFVFFGITDQYLKKLRKWILDSYILTKQSA